MLPLDLAVSRWMADHQDFSARRFFLTVTYLCTGPVFVALTMLTAAGLWLYRRRLESALFMGGIALTGGAVHILKILTVRVRPEGAALLHETGGSFPSGHAAFSLFFFGFLAYLLSRQVKGRPCRILICAAALLIAGVIGASRIYLNAHWVSDVLGGFVLAAAFLSLFTGFSGMRRDPEQGGER